MKIKPVIVILSVLFLIIDQSMAQSFTVHYSYDGSGNRVKRIVEEDALQEDSPGDSLQNDSLVRKLVYGNEKANKHPPSRLN